MQKAHPLPAPASKPTLHPVAWMLWTASAAGAALLTRNPWLLLLIGATAVGVRWRAQGRPPGKADLIAAAAIVAFPALLNLAFSRVGQTVLLEFPIPWVGGPYTLEALAFGLAAGVQIASLLAVMLLFAAAVSAVDLLRRTPPGLYPAGVTASIAMTFAPRVRRSFLELREAQRIRGHTPRGWRDLPGLVTPLVVLTLEGAFALAEGLSARGWAAGAAGGRPRAIALGWLGLAATLCLWAVFPAEGPYAAALGLGSLAALGLAFRSTEPYARFRPDVWRRGDTWVAGLSLGVLAVFLALAVQAPALLSYYPYPRAAWPALPAPLALAVLLLGAPGWAPAADSRSGGA